MHSLFIIFSQLKGEDIEPKNLKDDEFEDNNED